MPHCQQGSPLAFADGLDKIAPHRFYTPIMTCASGQFSATVRDQISGRYGEPTEA